MSAVYFCFVGLACINDVTCLSSGFIIITVATPVLLPWHSRSSICHWRQRCYHTPVALQIRPGIWCRSQTGAWTIQHFHLWAVTNVTTSACSCHSRHASSIASHMIFWQLNQLIQINLWMPGPGINVFLPTVSFYFCPKFTLQFWFLGQIYASTCASYSPGLIYM